MFRDIIVPCRIGNYYLYPRKILSFEINSLMISAVVIEFSGNSVSIKNAQTITLKDMSVQAQINALKKITSNVNSYDSIITTINSTSVVFKELELPFIGRDNLQMIIAYEVEALLPFSLDDAVIDFIIIQEDIEKNISKVLVAAVRKEDITNLVTTFEKADLAIDTATIDIFALQELYLQIFKSQIKIQPKKYFTFDLKSSFILKIWKNFYTKITKKPTPQSPNNPLEYQPISAQLCVDIGFDVTRVLYFQDNTLITMRMIPTGASDIAQHISQQTNVTYYDLMQNIITMHNTTQIQESLQKELQTFFEEINRTLHFFEKQQKVYLAPEKILFSGLLTTLETFHLQAQSCFTVPTDVLQPTTVIERLHIKTKQSYDGLSIINIATSLFEHFNPYVNFLKNITQKKDNWLLNKQIFAMIIITITAISLTLWKSNSELSKKESAYNSSKRQFIQTIQERMHIDLASEKNVKMIVEKAETKLKNEKKLWLAFAVQQEHSLLEYLQDLSVHIDRSTLNLIIKNMHLDYDKVTMSATLKDYADITVLQDEFAELQLLQPTEQIRDLSFTMQFKPKQIKTKDESKGNRS